MKKIIDNYDCDKSSTILQQIFVQNVEGVDLEIVKEFLRRFRSDSVSSSTFESGLEEGGEGGLSPLGIAIDYCNSNAVQCLLEHGADPSYIQAGNFLPWGNFLGQAIRMFFTDRTRGIITPGTTSAIITPAKRIEIVKLLLNNMSLDSINRKCKHGFTTLDCAYTFDYLIQNNPACFHVPMPPQKETMELF